MASGIVLCRPSWGKAAKVAKCLWQPWQSISHWDNNVLLCHPLLSELTLTPYQAFDGRDRLCRLRVARLPIKPFSRFALRFAVQLVCGFCAIGVHEKGGSPMHARQPIAGVQKGSKKPS